MNKQLLGCTALLLTSSVALAAPSVNGNTISWPDDGWYQVQDEETHTEACGGGRSCVVEPGSYVVINHSTGERFNGIEVVDEGNSASPIVVAGNTISWPDDGWYQVQDVETYTEVCGGGRLCVVEPGTYVVINHSTGERFRGIEVVDEGSSSNPPSVPTDLRGVVCSATAIELEWDASTDDDGTVVEYQVHRDGSLIATQSTLRFFENALTASTTHTYRVLTVDDEGNVSGTTAIDLTTLDDGPIVSEANYSVILPYVVGIANGNLFDDLRAMVDATDVSWLRRTGANFNDIAGLTLVDQANDPTGVWLINTYDCEPGGSYEYYKDTFIVFGGHFKGEYDACQIGSNTLSGNFNRKATVNKSPPNNEVLTSDYNLNVQNDGRGSTRNLTGKLTVDNSLIDNRFSLIEASYIENNLMWNTTINDIEIDVYATDEQPLENYALPFSRTFEASFEVQAPQTDDKPLTVAIEFETADATELNYQTGTLTVTAEDGSSMRMTLDNSNPDAFQLLLSNAGSSSALTIFWSDDYRLGCFHAPTFDARLAACE